MNETYNNLVELVHSLQQMIAEKGSAQIQKIYSSESQLSFSLRFKGETVFLLLGRGGQACGASLTKVNISSQHRLKDRFLDLMRNWLAGRRIYQVESFYNGAGIHFKYTGEVREGSFFALWAKSKLHFSIRKCSNDQNVAESFMPWREANIFKGDNAKSDEDIIKAYVTFIKPGEINESGLKEGAHQARSYGKLNRRKAKFHKRKVAKIENDIDRLSRLVALQDKIVHLREDELNQDYYEFTTYKLKFKREMNFYQKRDYIFQKIKDYKKALVILKRRLALARNDLVKSENQEVLEIKSKTAFMPEWVDIKSAQKKKTEHGEPAQIEKYTLSDGTLVMHGKDAAANEWLRSRWSKNEDYWFHLADRPSGHVYARLNKQVVDEMFLSTIGSMLCEANSTMIEMQFQLVYTQAKNIRGIKGKIGAVTMKKTKHFTQYYRGDWKEIIANL